jgi:hypothetical protein
LLYPGEVFFYSHLEKIITEYSYKCKKKVEGNPEGEISTEKWKHLKHVLPGEVNIISYCSLGSALAGQSEMAEDLDFKMKSEVSVLY